MARWRLSALTFCNDVAHRPLPLASYATATSRFSRFINKMSYLSSLLKELTGSTSEQAACPCAALHYLCDPNTCEQAFAIVSLGQELGQAPDWPVTTTVETLKKQVQKGCRLCGIIYNGLTTGRTSSSLTHSTYTYIMEDDYTDVLIHDNCGTISAESLVATVLLDFKPQRQYSTGCRVFTSCGGSNSTASKEAVEHIWHWMTECDRHKQCSDVFAARPLPNRVLDVSQAPQIRLLETNGDMKGWYVTLSHCWGLSKPLETTNGSLQSMTKGINWELLPPTFKHAIMVTQKMAVNYIWIDSLCILQDDARDWEIESANMQSIYANSILTIAASHAKDSREGCFSATGALSLDEYSSIKHSTGEDTGIMVRAARSLGHDAFQDRPFRTLGRFVDVLEHPLLYRGWVFQERLLSPRVVHFTKSELIWECEGAIRCQCKMIESDVGNDNIKASLSKSLLNKRRSETLIYQWLRIVEEFSIRRLTYTSDRLPAMSGLAKRFSHSSLGLGSYLAGLWTKDLAISLIWRPASSREDSRPAGTPYIAPTWSWASINGPIFFSCSDDLKSRDERRLHTPCVDIVEANCTPATLDPTGKVSAGYIKVTGLMAPAKLNYAHYSYTEFSKYSIDAIHWLISCPQLDQNLLFAPDVDPFWGLSIEPKPKGTMDILFILWSTTATKPDEPEDNENMCYAMIVRESPSVPGAYERMGMKHMERVQKTRGELNASQLFRDAEERTITIV